MPDRITVTRRTSWFSRLSESIKSVVFGFLLFVLAFPLLFWNEGRAVRTARSLEEGAGVVVSVSPDEVDPAKEGKLVHVSGFARTEDVLEDEIFGVSENAVRLVREVSMFQWVETEHSRTETKLGGGEETVTTYEYSTDWADEIVDSSAFQSAGDHRNPSAFPYEPRTMTAGTVFLGEFALSAEQIDRLARSESLRIEALPAGIRGRARLDDGGIYIGADPARPAVGDTRVRFRVVRPGAVSVVARQAGDTFEPYRASAGASIFLLEESIASATAMIETAEAQNTLLTWVLRGAGFFLMFLGLSLVFRPLAVFGDVVPLVGRLLRVGVGAVSAALAAFFGFVTIAIGWLAYRPLLGVVLLALGAGALFFLTRAARRRPASVQAPAVPPLPLQR
jgi:hypothetical protein